MHGCRKNESQFVITRGNSSEILQPAKGIFDLVPFAILLFAESKSLLPIASVRYNSFGSLILQLLPQLGAIVALVRQQKFSRLSFFDQLRTDRTVMRLAARQHKSQKAALGIGDRVTSRSCLAPRPRS